MIIFKDNSAKYIYLIAITLLQLFGSNSAAEDITCVICGGANKPCSEDLSEKPQNCPDEKISQCYTQIDTDGKIERGCYKDEEGKKCLPENNCVLTLPGKNNQLICKKCDSSDKVCSQTEMNSNDLKYNQICGADAKKCIVKVDNKLVVRGCAGASDQCTDPKICKTCETVNCNTGIFPEGRCVCYQCNGNGCNDVTSVTSKPCLNFVENDQCYTAGESDTTMNRGCKSDTEDNKCSSNDKGCAFCSSNDCNKLKYKHAQELKCHQCTGNATNNDCFKEQTDTNYKNCEKEILYNEEEYCYTQIEDGTVKRGCLHDNAALTIDKCGDGDKYICSKCNHPVGCNNRTIEFTCIRCRSDIDPKCWNQANKLQGQKCRGESQITDGCFSGIWHGVMIRGCVVDASIQNQVICKDPKDNQCTVCHKKDCNNLTSSAAKIGLSYCVLLISLIILRKYK